MTRSTRPPKGTGAGKRLGRGGAAPAPETGVSAEYERGGAVPTVPPTPERRAAVEAALLGILAEVTTEVEAGRLTTMAAHRLQTATKMAFELAKDRLTFRRENL